MEAELTLEEIPFDDMGGGLDPRAVQFTASVSQQEEMMRVAAYQEQLKKLGYYKGKIDGIWGRLTRNAYEQYSRDSQGKGNRTVVKSGDTLSKIANTYGVSVQQIAAINPQIANINRIQVGQVINLPYFIKTSSTSNSKPTSKSNNQADDIAHENSAKPLPEVVVTVKRSNSSKPSQTQAKPIQGNNPSNESKPFLYDALWSITGPIRALNAEATRFGETYSDATMHSLNNLWKAPWNRKSYILPHKNNH